MQDSRAPILVVEDDPAIRITIADLLETEGYAVETAVGGEDAIRRLRDDGLRPCVVLLDLMMPGVNGLEVLELIRQTAELAELPVIVMTAASMSVPPGVRRIQKPMDIDVLLAAVEESCR